MRTIDPRRIELMDPAMKEMLRDKTPAECFRMVGACNRGARLRMAGHLKTVHPDWDNAQIQAGVAQWLNQMFDVASQDEYPNGGGECLRNVVGAEMSALDFSKFQSMS